MKQSMIVTIAGRSGTGKSTSIRNLNPETTAIISTDGKPMPFKGAGKFKIAEVGGEDPKEMFTLLDSLRDNKTIENVVIDAFSQWSEALTFYCNRKYKGFDRQNNYNDALFMFFEKLKALEGKVVFIFAHPVIGETFEG